MRFKSHSLANGKIKNVIKAYGLLFTLAATTASAAEPLTFVGFDPASHSAAAQEGLEEIFSGRCFHAGVPVEAMKAMAAAVPETQTDLGYDPDSPEGQYYGTANIPSPPNRSSGLNLGDSIFERNGVALGNGNCFSCHAGIVNGQVVAGLGNNRILPSAPSKGDAKPIDMTKLESVLTSDAARKELAENMQRGQIIKFVLPESPSRGDNFGPFAVWSLIAHIDDPKNTGFLTSDEKTELVRLVESTRVSTVDPMPWWLMKYKKRDYWYSDGKIDDAAHFSVNFTTSHPEVNENHAAHVASTAKALAFARETQSPLFPGSLDAKLVKKGADLFHGRAKPIVTKGFIACKTCHGTYTKKASEPDLSKPGSWKVSYNGSHILRNVKTDESYNAALRTFSPLVKHLDKLAAYYESKGTSELTPRYSVPTKKGYVAPPLVGVWASAPYFHNGSVPTIATVLNSKERPEIWARETRDPHAYDLNQVGMKYKPMSRAEFDASAENAADAHPLSTASIDHRSIYDTTGFGHGNMGHTFGDGLSPDERSSVIEFLKSLSGPDM